MHSFALLLAVAVTGVTAFNCETHTFGTCADNIVHWYDPDDGMICDPLDCGGGRAPPKTNNPCCGNYKGTETCNTAASFMPCFKAMASSTQASEEPTSSATEVVVTSTDASTSVKATEAASGTGEQPVSTGKPSESGSVVGSTSVVSVTKAPGGVPTGVAGGNSTSVVTSAKGNATLSGTGAPKNTPAGGAAGTVRFDALAAIAGVVVALA